MQKFFFKALAGAAATAALATASSAAAATGCANVHLVNNVTLVPGDGTAFNGFTAGDTIAYTFTKSAAGPNAATITGSAVTVGVSDTATNGNGTVTVTNAAGNVSFRNVQNAGGTETVTFTGVSCVAPAAAVPTLSPLALALLSMGMIGAGWVAIRRYSPFA